MDYHPTSPGKSRKASKSSSRKRGKRRRNDGPRQKRRRVGEHALDSLSAAERKERIRWEKVRCVQIKFEDARHRCTDTQELFECYRTWRPILQAKRRKWVAACTRVREETAKRDMRVFLLSIARKKSDREYAVTRDIARSHIAPFLFGALLEKTTKKKKKKKKKKSKRTTEI